MEDMIYVICVVVVTVVVIAFIIIMGKKRFDAISAETFSVDMDMQTDEASGEISTEKGGNPADVLFASSHYVQYESQFDETKRKIREDMERGYTLRQCSKIIDAYNRMNENEVFDMMGNIWVVVPEPQVRTLLGHKDAPDEPVEVIFDAYYDNWHIRGLLEGQGSLSSSFHGSKVYHRIPQYLADKYGVPQILVDEKVTVTLEEQKIKWSVSIDPAVQLYGLYDVVGFRERFEIFSDLLKSRYPNLNNLIITFRH